MGTRAPMAFSALSLFPGRDPGVRAGLVSLALVGFALFAMARLVPLYGLSITALLTLPLALIGWTFGLRAALFAAALAIPGGIAVCLETTTSPMLLAIISAHAGVLFIACVTGRLCDLSREVARELEEHARAVRLLRHDEARNQALLSALPDLIFRLDVSGKVSGASGARGRASSLRSATYIDQLFPAETAELLRERARDVLEDGEPERLEYRSSEHEEPGDYEARLVKCAPDQVLVIVRNVTRQKRLEHELIAAKEAALEAARSKTKFLASMSHEIRTPMNGVIGMTNLLLETPLNPEQREYSQIIQKSGQMLLDIIDDILDFAKIEAGKLELERIEFDLLLAVEESLEAVAAQAHAKGVDLGCVFRDAPRRVTGDPARLRQVLANLLGNAVRYTEHGFVRLEVNRERLTGRISFCVADSGPGVAPELVPRLFRPMLFGESSHGAARDGTGLGLAIAHELVQLMGGGIAYEGRPGEGAVFRFNVTLEALPSPAEEPALDLEGARVLVIRASGAPRLIDEQLRSIGVAPSYVEPSEQALTVAVRVAQEAGRPFLAVWLEAGREPSQELSIVTCMRATSELKPVPLVLTLPSEARDARYEELRASATRVLSWPVRRTELIGCLGALRRRSEGAPRPSPKPASERLNARVLVAEDNAINQRVAQRTLERLGCTAVIVEHGRQALEAALAEPFDVILMDCQMPVLDGFDATRQIRALERGRRTPIVAMTAGGADSDRERCREAGMDAYVTKPITPEQLRDTIRDMIQATANDATSAGKSGSFADQTLDLTVLSELDSLGGGDPEFLRELVQLFVEQAPRQLDAARAALNVRDHLAVAKAAHTLKSSSGYLGARRLSGLCAEVERRAHAGDGADLTRALEELSAEYDAVRSALTSFLERGTG